MGLRKFATAKNAPPTGRSKGSEHQQARWQASDDAPSSDAINPCNLVDPVDILAQLSKTNFDTKSKLAEAKWNEEKVGSQL